MRELVLVQPGGQARVERERREAEAALAREFEERLGECGGLAFRVARSVLHNDADAEDAAQETMLRAYRRFSRLREREKFRGWIVRIAFRMALDRVKSKKRREARETNWARPESRPGPPNAEELAASAQFQERLEAALDELPEKLRLALVLSAMEGHTTEEVASMLGVPEGTVKSRVFEARKRLAERLQWAAKNTGKR